MNTTTRWAIYTVSIEYLNSKRSDSRTQPKFVPLTREVKQFGLQQESGKYVGLPVGNDAGRTEFLNKAADRVIGNIRDVCLIGDSEVEYRLIKHSAVAWARYPTASIPTKGVTDKAMHGYVDNIDAAIDKAVERILG